MVGYAWPASADTETVWEVEQPTNVTSDLATSQVGLYVDYTDLFQNNINGYATFDALPVNMDNIAINAASTDQVTEMPNLYYGAKIQTTGTTNGLGDFHISYKTYFKNVIQTYHTSYPNLYPAWEDTYSIYLMPGDDFDSINNGAAKLFIYYPKLDMAQLITTDNTIIEKDPLTSQIVLSGGSPNTSQNVYFTYRTLGSTSPYADLNQGMVMPVRDSTYENWKTWYNGYTNLTADILFNVFSGSYISYRFVETDGSYWSVEILGNRGGDMEINIYKNGVWQQLGRVDLFPYVWMNVDTVANKVTFYSLGGMSGYLDDFRQHTRQVLSFDADLAPFTYFNFQNRNYDNDDGVQTWLVRSTTSNVASAPGIENNTIDLRDYANSGDGQIQIKSLALWPTIADGLTVTVNGSQTVSGTIDETGRVVFPDIYDGTIQNLAISMIGNNVYINGIKAIESTGFINTCVISFNGEWLAYVYYSDLTASSKPVYGWLAGAFSIDQGGFCMAGLLTSGGAATGALLYGRRTGAKTAMVALTAAICAAFYLVMLMQ